MGFAHGFCVLSEEADVLYKVTAEYAPEMDRGVIWDDPEIGIRWPINDPTVFAEGCRASATSFSRQQFSIRGKKPVKSIWLAGGLLLRREPLEETLNVTRVAVIGRMGQLGTDLANVLVEAGSYEVFGLSHQEIECTDPASVEKTLKTVRPDVVVNCAAFVRVDDSEDRADETFRVNSLGALNVARACAEIDALCVYISTDYVFDGEKGSPYMESDARIRSTFMESQNSGRISRSRGLPPLAYRSNGEPVWKGGLQRQRWKLRGNDLGQSEDRRVL